MQLNARVRMFLYWIFQARSSGLKKEKFDHRDYKVEEHLGWGFGYKPKHKRKVIPQLSVKNQAPYNTCVWNATTGQKEIDENVILSPRSIVTRGRQSQLLIRDGIASLRSGQKVLSDWGIMQDSELPDQPHKSFNEYSSAKLDSKKASRHRTKSYFSVRTRNAIIKAIDDGHVVVSGIKWYTGWNTRYLPKNALISGNVGYPVGGHAIKLIGYLQFQVTQKERNNLYNGIITVKELCKKYGIQH